MKKLFFLVFLLFFLGTQAQNYVSFSLSDVRQALYEKGEIYKEQVLENGVNCLSITDRMDETLQMYFFKKNYCFRYVIMYWQTPQELLSFILDTNYKKFGTNWYGENCVISLFYDDEYAAWVIKFEQEF